MEYPDDYGITGLKIEYLDDDDDIANLNMEYPDEDDITNLNMGFQDQSYDPRPGEGFMLFIFFFVGSDIDFNGCLFTTGNSQGEKICRYESFCFHSLFCLFCSDL